MMGWGDWFFFPGMTLTCVLISRCRKNSGLESVWPSFSSSSSSPWSPPSHPSNTLWCKLAEAHYGYPQIHTFMRIHQLTGCTAERSQWISVWFFFFFYSSNPPVRLTVLLSTFSVVWKRCALSFNLTICAACSMPAPHVFCQFLFCKNKQRDSLWTVTPVDPSPPVLKKNKKNRKKEELSDLEWGTEQYWSNTGTRHTVLRKTVVTLMLLDELET